MSLNSILATAPLTTSGYHIKANGTTLGNSLIWDNGTNVGIGNTNTSYTLDVTGTGRFTTDTYFATSSGNIGIGTTTPVLTAAGRKTVDINGTSTSLLSLSVSGVNKSYFYFDGTDTQIYSSAVLAMYAGGAEKMRITSTGDVGIGTSTISQPSAGATTLRIVGTSTTKAGAIVLDSSDSSVSSYIYPDNTNGLSINTSTVHPITFRTSGTTRLTIASTGAATFSGTVYTGGATTASGLTGASELIVQNEIGIQCTDTTGPYLRMVAGSVNQDFTFVVNALSGTIPNLLFNVNSAERMRITGAGNVLINQTTDQLSTYKLQVTGNARFNDSIIFPTAAAANAGDMYLGQGSKYSGGFTENDFLLINQGSSSAGIVQITAGVVTNGVYLARNANSWSAVSSDARNKKDFETTQGLAEVLQIEPVKYNYIWDEEGETKRLGFTAQNLQSLIPEMVIATGKKADDGSDYLTITPDYLLPVLVKAIQEMNTKLDAQNQTIQNLQEQINILAK